MTDFKGSLKDFLSFTSRTKRIASSRDIMEVKAAEPRRALIDVSLDDVVKQGALRYFPYKFFRSPPRPTTLANAGLSGDSPLSLHVVHGGAAA